MFRIISSGRGFAAVCYEMFSRCKTHVDWPSSGEESLHCPRRFAGLAQGSSEDAKAMIRGYLADAAGKAVLAHTLGEGPTLTVRTLGSDGDAEPESVVVWTSCCVALSDFLPLRLEIFTLTKMFCLLASPARS